MGDIDDQGIGDAPDADRPPRKYRGDPGFSEAISEMSEKLDELLEVERRRRTSLSSIALFAIGVLSGCLMTWYMAGPGAETPPGTGPVTYHSWKFRVFPEPIVVAIVGALLGIFGLSMFRALSLEFRERRKVRIKFGDRVVEYSPGISEEEFDRKVSEAIRG